jgi:hypothetical protein
MKIVWILLCTGLLGVMGAAPSMAQASELTRAEVKSELADYQAVGYEFSEAGYPELAVDAARKVAALRAARAAAGSVQQAEVSAKQGN